MNGTWKTGFYYGNIKDGFTDIAPFGGKLVSKKTRAAIMGKRQQGLIKRHVLRVHGPALRPGGKAPGSRRARS